MYVFVSLVPMDLDVRMKATLLGAVFLIVCSLFELPIITTYLDDAVVLLAGQWTCDLQVVGSSPGWAPLRSGFG